MWQTRVAIVDEVLAEHRVVLGADLDGYRNHVYRVFNLGLMLSNGEPDAPDRLAVAAVFHDLGIWTAGTFDYLGPSVDLAVAYLQRIERSPWVPEVGSMILEHHKLSRYRGDGGRLVEAFRQADWIDVTGGWRAFGLSRRVVRDLYAHWPSAGFHGRLVRLELARLRTHPWSPLPMLRL
jgi:hypothetical protein